MCKFYLAVLALDVKMTLRQFRRDGWIGAVRERANSGLRAPTDVWDQFLEHFAQKCEGSLKNLESRT